MMTEDEIRAYRNVMNMLNSNDNEPTEDDKIFRKNTTTQIVERDKEYTELLSHFVNITKIRNNIREWFKWIFFAVVILSIIILVIITYSLFHKYVTTSTIKEIVNSLPLLITAIIGFISVIISIPATITKYLFSTEEDENITKIILHTQDHDTSGRQWAMDFKNFVDELEKEHETENDNESA